MYMTSSKKIRVCDISVGAAGLCALRDLAEDFNYLEPEALKHTGCIVG